MKASGIVRRVDDLGRIVIPKEIRRSIGIKEGDPLELFTDTINGSPAVCLAKYPAVSYTDQLTALAAEIVDELEDENDKAMLNNAFGIIALMLNKLATAEG